MAAVHLGEVEGTVGSPCQEKLTLKCGERKSCSRKEKNLGKGREGRAAPNMSETKESGKTAEPAGRSVVLDGRLTDVPPNSNMPPHLALLEKVP